MSKKILQEYNKAQIEKIKSNLKEAPISYEGPERMDPSLQSKLESEDFKFLLDSPQHTNKFKNRKD